jgi:protein-tyrosine phosphatase
MLEVLDWQRDDLRAVLQRSVQLLSDGHWVVFPTDAGYAVAANGLAVEAVMRLPQAEDRADEPALSVAVRGPAEALDWVPALSPLARRLTQRCWPGAVRFVFDAPADQGIGSRLPIPVRQRLCSRGTLSLCMPRHDAVLSVLRFQAAPLVLAMPRGKNGQIARTAEDMVQHLDSAPCLVIDGGPVPSDAGATVVRVNGDQWQVTREGVVPAALLQQMLPCRIVFVCTGNTCRSPLAAVLCQKLLAEHLDCTPEDLSRRGFIVQSAGVAAAAGGEAAPEAVEVAQELGVDLSHHRTQPLTAALAGQADFLFAMTYSHVRALNYQLAGTGPEPRLLCGDEDLADPIGCDQSVYRECAQNILVHLTRLLPEFQQYSSSMG